MKIITGKRVLWLVALGLFTMAISAPIGCAPNSGASTYRKLSYKEIDTHALLKDLQKTASDSSDKVTIVWWLPDEFWGASAAKNPDMNAKDVQNFVSVVKGYTIFAIADGTIDSNGIIKSNTEKQITSALKLKYEGQTYTPISLDEKDQDLKEMLQATKEVFANSLSKMGMDVNFYLFPANDKNGKRLLQTGRDGSFSIVLDDRQYQWQLPLPSLVPSKTCPKCKEQFRNNYKFCPWDGSALQVS